MSNRALFLDRDGVINVDRHHVHRIEDFDFIPGVFDALRHAQSLGYTLLVVTNQSGIGRGLYTENEFLALDTWMNDVFCGHGVVITRTYYCPHHPDAASGAFKKDCECRKPKPGMILRAAKELGIDLHESVLIGDKNTDIEAAGRAGIRKTWMFEPEANSSTNMQEGKGWMGVVRFLDDIQEN